MRRPVLISLTVLTSLLLAGGARAADLQTRLDQLNQREKQLLQKLEAVQQRERDLQERLDEVRLLKQAILNKLEVRKLGTQAATPAATP